MTRMPQRFKIYPFLLAIVLAGTLVESVKSKPERDQPESDLRLTLSSKSLMLCLGSSLHLDLVIANQGINEVKIDKVDLWSQFSYSFSATDGSGRGGGRGSSCDHCRGNYIVLPPGGRYESSFEYPLDEFFKDAGKYTIKMTYEQISTNELTFELYDCNPQ